MSALLGMGEDLRLAFGSPIKEPYSRGLPALEESPIRHKRKRAVDVADYLYDPAQSAEVDATNVIGKNSKCHVFFF